MKRPLEVAGFIYLAAQMISVLCGFTVSVTLFAVCVLLFALTFVIRTEKAGTVRTVLLCAAVSLGSFSVYHLVSVRPAQSLEGRTAHICGRVTEQPFRSEGRYYYYVDTTSVTPEGIALSGVPQKVRIRLSSPVSVEADADDIISCRVTFGRADSRSFSSASVRLKARGVTASGYIDGYGSETAVTAGKPTPYGRIVRLRSRLKRRISALFGSEHTALLYGMLFGDKSEMDGALVRKFRRSGISHYLAVSGLHLSLFAMTAEKLLLLCRLGLRKRSAVMPLFVLFFMALAGFSASVIRAGFMTGFYYAARAVSREDDPRNSLGASVLAMCAISPYAAADPGMLMSVSATYGLITIAPKVQKYAVRRIFAGRSQPDSSRKAPDRLRGAAARIVSAAVTSLVASLSVFPVSALYFGEVSLVAVPCNICCIYPAYGFLLFGALAALVSAIPVIGRYPGIIVSLPAKASGWLLVKLAGFFALPSWSVLNTNYRCLPAAFIVLAAVSLLARHIYRRGGSKAVRRAVSAGAAVSVMLSGICVCAEAAADRSAAEICVFDAGDGIACYAGKGRDNVLVCTACDEYRLWLMSERLDKMKLDDLGAVMLLEDSDVGFNTVWDIALRYRPENVYLPEYVFSRQDTDRFREEYGCEIMPVLHTGPVSYTGPVLYTGARYESGRDGVNAELFYDGQGLEWVWISAGGLDALIAPEGGDCACLSGKLRSPDIVIIGSERVSNLSALRTKAVIISADSEEASRTEALLRYRGVENICAVPAEGSVRITLHKDGIKAEELD